MCVYPKIFSPGRKNNILNTRMSEVSYIRDKYFADIDCNLQGRKSVFQDSWTAGSNMSPAKHRKFVFKIVLL